MASLLLGDYNELEVVRDTSVGLYLTSDDGDLLLPNKYVEPGTRIGDVVRVFVYRDSEDRLIATTLRPLALVDSFAALTVRDHGPAGSFLDWGLEKDLLLPYRNQRRDLRVGERVLVYVYLDEESDRLVATAKWKPFLSKKPFPGQPGDEVQLLIADESELGYTVIVNGSHQGLLYHNEVFRPLRLGEQITGFLRTVRDDGKLDVRLQREGYGEVENATETLLKALKAAPGGRLPIGDKSLAEDVYRRVGMSKKVFKKALGSLFKQGLVVLYPDETLLKP
ncbi:S1-like domain-containing RNA-binding protein [Hymenobacter saemangeumensis]|uniref:S1-like domain-containing RNA-binding protein n=1 Tax=Hymenobacter saemangeumensis TaxID=1084522 RepID=A0ABP8HW62_9BACT